MGPFIKALREKYDYTQAQAAEAIGISSSHLSKIENNRTDISITRFLKFIEAIIGRAR